MEVVNAKGMNVAVARFGERMAKRGREDVGVWPRWSGRETWNAAVSKPLWPMHGTNACLLRLRLWRERWESTHSIKETVARPCFRFILRTRCKQDYTIYTHSLLRQYSRNIVVLIVVAGLATYT
jgi:hypothetical protein